MFVVIFVKDKLYHVVFSIFHPQFQPLENINKTLYNNLMTYYNVTGSNIVDGLILYVIVPLYNIPGSRADFLLFSPILLPVFFFSIFHPRFHPLETLYNN